MQLIKKYCEVGSALSTILVVGLLFMFSQQAWVTVQKYRAGKTSLQVGAAITTKNRHKLGALAQPTYNDSLLTKRQ